MEFSERIAAIMRHYKLQAREMAELCGVQRTAISHILNGRNRPSVGFLSQLSEAFPDLNTRWLLHGKDSMFTFVTPETQADSQTNKEVESFTVAVNNDSAAQGEELIHVREEEPARYETNVTKQHKSEQKPNVQARLVKVMLLYEDGHFETYLPGHL